jgi:hypothetical protein
MYWRLRSSRFGRIMLEEALRRLMASPLSQVAGPFHFVPFQPSAQEICMAKAKRRGNLELRKPKASKSSDPTFNKGNVSCVISGEYRDRVC